MFKNYFKVALRNFIKNKLNFSINTFGLAVGFAASIIIFLFVRNELTYDDFHENSESIYLVYKERITPTGTQITRDTWLPMAEALRNDYPSIKNAARIWDDDNSWVQVEGNRFQENITYADPALFEIFTFPLLEGDLSTTFADINSAVISQEVAVKYFGETSPIGKSITLNYETDYIIRGVLDEIPQNSTIEIDILVPCESAAFYEENKENWDSSWLSTFIQLSEGNTAESLETQFPQFVAKIWGEELNTSMNLKLTHLPDLYNEITDANTYAYILLGISVVILIIASINFMNLTTARSIERAREIGMRKVLGAFRRQLIGQFLNESLVVSILALFLGIGLLELLLPVFNTYYDLSLSINYLSHFGTISGLFALAVIVGLISGFYPALVISRFQPSESLKGQLKSSPVGRKLRYALVLTQFCLAIILIIGTGVMWNQVQYMKNANLNFDRENVIAIPVRPSDFENREQAQVSLEAFKNELRQYSGIKSVASSTHIPGRWPGWFTFAYPTDRDDSQRLRIRRSFVDAHYFDTYGISFAEGRNFSEQLATDADNSMIINETALRDIGWNSAKGRQIRVGETIYNVIGVVKDYHFQSLASEMAPILHFYRPSDHGVHRVFSVKMTGGNGVTTLDYIKEKWQTLDPSRAFEFFFVDENFDRLYENENRLSAVTSSFAILAIMIACLGLFALASLIVTQRTKEIGVRKILGASVLGIVLLLTGVFTRLVGLAFILACPISYFAANKWLADFAYRTDLGIEIFMLAGLLSIVISFFTVSYHSVKAALANPVEALRYE